MVVSSQLVPGSMGCLPSIFLPNMTRHTNIRNSLVLKSIGVSTENERERERGGGGKGEEEDAIYITCLCGSLQVY